MNKNLMAIFHKDFRVGDVVNTEIMTYEITKIHNKFALVVSKYGKQELREQWIHTKFLTLITPYVPLWGVLEKLNIRDCAYRVSKLEKELLLLRLYSNEKGHYIYLKWILSDKSGEVPLHRQSKETQDQLWEVLK